MRKTDTVRVRHMLEAAREALSFAKGKTRTDLDEDRMLVLSLVKEVEIIGEAATQVTPEIKTRHPEIPWQDMALMRNRLIHAYFDVDLNVVWETIQKDLPELAAKLEPLLPPLPSEMDFQEPRAAYRAGKPKPKKAKPHPSPSRSLRAGRRGRK